MFPHGKMPRTACAPRPQRTSLTGCCLCPLILRLPAHSQFAFPHPHAQSLSRQCKEAPLGCTQATPLIWLSAATSPGPEGPLQTSVHGAHFKTRRAGTGQPWEEGGCLPSPQGGLGSKRNVLGTLLQLMVAIQSLLPSAERERELKLFSGLI